jgi:hypothetical protein
MDINQELERLHKSFQINQESNKGDRSGELIFLIDAIYADLFGTKKYRTEMDMSLKEEMIKCQLPSESDCSGGSTMSSQPKEIINPIAPEDDNHGFDIPEELQPAFDKFKQFLKDNNAEVYWERVKDKESDFFKRQKDQIGLWVTTPFEWKKTPEGHNYWELVDKKLHSYLGF